jgi:diguanylate cyclase (GGDEF)-like protein/PAS domain S-box-containing protein
VVRPDGTVRWLADSGTVVAARRGADPVLVGTTADVTDQVEVREALLSIEDRYRLLTETSTDMISVTTGRDRIYQFVSAASMPLLGYRPEELVGRSAHELFHPDELPRLLHTLGYDRRFPDLFNVQQRVRHRDGHWVWVEARVRVIRDPETGDVVERHASTRDISERRRAEEALAHQAAHDRLTGLPNRFLLADRIAMAMSRLQRTAGHVGLLFIDLDRFKTVNDSLGHAAGDEVLVQVAARLRSALRAGDTAVRFAGDEFVVLCENLVGEDEAVLIAQRLLALLERPVTAGGRSLAVSVSIGVAAVEEPTSATELLARADAAMYDAKRRGRARVAVTDVAGSGVRRRRAELETRLRRAVDSSQLIVEYEPIVDVETEQVVAAEALVRWRRPHREDIRPREFVAIAEEIGLIGAIGASVVRQVCRQLHEWIADGLRPVPVWVNVSAAQLGTDHDFPGFLAQQLAEHGLDGSLIGCEITESVLVQEHDEITATLRRIRALGVGVAIDDFGTGYSSLAYLHRLPVDVVKVDKAFTDQVTADATSRAVLRAVIELSRALALGTVAEGVETREQLEVLRSMSCHRAQGYLFSRSVAGAAFASFLPGSQRCGAGSG